MAIKVKWVIKLTLILGKLDEMGVGVLAVASWAFAFSECADCLFIYDF